MNGPLRKLQLSISGLKEIQEKAMIEKGHTNFVSYDLEDMKDYLEKLITEIEILLEALTE